MQFTPQHVIILYSQKNKAREGFEPSIFGLRDRRLATWPPRRNTCIMNLKLRSY